MSDINQKYKSTIDILLRLLVVSAIFFFSYRIIEPFAQVVVWSIIIAISLANIHSRLSRWLRNSPKTAAFVLVFFILTIIIFPFVSLTESLIHNTKTIKDLVNNEEFSVFEPNEKVKDWPGLGEKFYNLWTEVAINTSEFISKHTDKLKGTVEFLIDIVTKTAKAVIFFIASIVLAGFLLVYKKERQNLGRRIGDRLAGEQGVLFAAIAEKTISNVVTGVIGVSVIQSLMAGIGFFVGGLPYAGIWTLLCLILAIVQIGTLIVIAPAIIWYFSTNDTTAAIIFLVWMSLTLVLDNVLKPIFYGRGSSVPMLVIFIGAVGGLLNSGIIGLFIGPVILAFAYELFRYWINQGEMKPIPELEGGVIENEEKASEPTD